MRHGMNKSETVAESLIQIIAGSDTTATAIRSTVLHIITTPRVYQRLKKDIKIALDVAGVSSPITNTQAKNLEYFQVWVGPCAAGR